MLTRLPLPILLIALTATPANGEQMNKKPGQMKVAAVQMLGYDKTDVPRPGFDPSEAVFRYIEKAAKESYITATINLEQVRKARKNSRNIQQRRPELYGEIVKPICQPEGTSP